MAATKAFLFWKGDRVTAREELTVVSETWNLVLRAREGDAAAFERLLVLHERQVLGTAARILRDSEEAKDAAQEVFLKLYRNLSRIRADADLRAWLYRVTVNACWDLLRKSRRSASVPLAVDELVAPDRTDESIALDEQNRILASALLALPFKERAAVVLRDIEGLSTEETASVLESSAVTVRSQIARARIKIKRHVDRALGRMV